MALAESYGGSATIGTTEYSLTNNSTTIASQTVDGIYSVLLDLNAMTITEVYEFRVLEKTTSTATQRALYVAQIAGVQNTLWTCPPLPLFHGWEMTLKKIAGTDRSLIWSIRAVQ